tara:strand:- start:1182 stop:2324 length:1143 start_codon:yes stop_codon:yes gene_type:complete
MAIKITAASGVFSMTDTLSNILIYSCPTASIWCNTFLLSRNRVVFISPITRIKIADIAELKLSDCVNSSNVKYTTSSFISFVHANLGKSPSTGGGAEGPEGPQGIQGETGLTGPQGLQGVKGDTGNTGPQGLKGDTGDTGPLGPQGVQGLPGNDGSNGSNGVDGISAYEVALANGFVGTEVEWLASLVGADGVEGAQGLQGIQGPQGLQGETGLTGPEGLQGIQGEPGVGGGGSDWTYVKLTSDAISTVTANADTDLRFTPLANKHYEIEGKFFLESVITTTGVRPGIKWPTTGLLRNVAWLVSPSSATAFTSRFWGNTAAANSASTGVAVANEGIYGEVKAMMVTSGTIAGDFIITIASEIAASQVKINADSFIRYREI